MDQDPTWNFLLAQHFRSKVCCWVLFQIQEAEFDGGDFYAQEKFRSTYHDDMVAHHYLVLNPRYDYELCFPIGKYWNRR